MHCRARAHLAGKVRSSSLQQDVRMLRSMCNTAVLTSSCTFFYLHAMCKLSAASLGWHLWRGLSRAKLCSHRATSHSASPRYSRIA